MSEENKYCWNCHAENQKENVFCIKCGENLEEPKETEGNTGNNDLFEKVEIESPKLAQADQNRKDEGNQHNNIGTVPVIQEGTRKSSFFNFDKMISPQIIKGLFMLSVLISTIVGILMIIGSSGSYGGGSIVLLGVFILIVSPLITRVISERAIVVFKIHETLEEIRKNPR